MPARTPVWRRFLLTACLFAMVVGANWATFDRFGSDMPDWDQWDAEALNLFAPWYEHDHFVAHLFQPHNEHRVVLTKLQNLAVCVANGQWDARLECACNALLHGLIAVAFWLLARRWLASRWQPAAYVVIAALYGLPLAWQNLLGGFHSQQYWLIGLSFAAILLVPFSRTWRTRWWLGIVAATLALGSMGSGFLAAVVIAGLVTWRWMARELRLRDAWPTLLIMTGLIAVGVLTRVEVDYHQHLKAKTAHDFGFSILRSLEWPLREHDWAGALTWAPWLVLSVSVARRMIRVLRAPVGSRPHLPASDLVLVALGGWVIIQLVATAYARGANADYPASRYMDTLIFAAAVNALALGWLLSSNATRAAGGVAEAGSANRSNRSSRSSISRRYGVALVSLAWFGANTVGLCQLVRRNVVDELPSTKQYYVDTEAHLRGYLATDDPAELSDPIPYPSPEALIERLRPSIRAIVPQSVRPPLLLSAPTHETDTTTFIRNLATQHRLNDALRAGLSPDTPALAARPTWGSYGPSGAAQVGAWRSAPIVAPLHAWLKFETAGRIGEPGVALELHDAVTDRLLAEVRPTRVPRNTWRSAYVRAPDRPFVVVARDADPNGWLAFSAPVEMGRLSYVAWQAVKNGLLLAEVAAALVAVVAVWSWFGPRRVTPVEPAAAIADIRMAGRG